MHLSTNHRFQEAKITTGFECLEFNSLSEFKSIVVSDHSPAMFDHGIRLSANVITCDCVVMDVDNVEAPYVTIDDFITQFEGACFYIATSRSHMKEKKSGKKICEPIDRYHVYFPLKRPMFSHEYKYIATELCNNFKFFDPACKDASRFFFGNTDTQVFYNPGRMLDIEPPKPQIELEPPDSNTSVLFNETNDSRSRLFSSLQVASSNGAFETRDKWITLGMALKRDGFTVNDWIALSWPDVNRHHVQHCWDSFTDSGSITGKTLTYIAKEYAPDAFKPSYITSVAVKQQASSSVQLSINELKMPKPAHLESDVSIAVADARKKELYYSTIDDDGKEVKKLHEDWYFRIVEMDADIANCVHYDYTVGTKSIAYHNTEILKNAVLQRLRRYVTVGKISRMVVDRIIDHVESKNMNRNRVIDRIDYLKYKHPIDETKPMGWELDEFLSLMEFQSPPDEMYSQQELRAIYREIWDLFFTRMHIHLDGTRLVNGDYKGLIENDIVPILQGPQDAGKTTLARAIGMGDYYIDLGSGGKGGFGSADTQKSCRGMIIAELGEMKIMRKSDDIETIKSFISKAQYDVDIKYVEFTKPLPVTVSFIGTANMGEYLSDTTGNRRFWPIWISQIFLQRLAMSKELIEKLHVCYARKAENIGLEGRFDSLKKSDSLVKYLEASRTKAMVRYSDYEAIVEYIELDFIEKKMNHSETEKYHRLQNFEIEKIISIHCGTFKLSIQAINQAMPSLGYTRSRYSKNSRTVTGWSKPFPIQEEY